MLYIYNERVKISYVHSVKYKYEHTLCLAVPAMARELASNSSSCEKQFQMLNNVFIVSYLCWYVNWAQREQMQWFIRCQISSTCSDGWQCYRPEPFDPIETFPFRQWLIYSCCTRRGPRTILSGRQMIASVRELFRIELAACSSSYFRFWGKSRAVLSGHQLFPTSDDVCSPPNDARLQLKIVVFSKHYIERVNTTYTNICSTRMMLVDSVPMHSEWRTYCASKPFGYDVPIYFVSIVWESHSALDAVCSIEMIKFEMILCALSVRRLGPHSTRASISAGDETLNLMKIKPCNYWFSVQMIQSSDFAPSPAAGNFFFDVSTRDTAFLFAISIEISRIRFSFDSPVRLRYKHKAHATRVRCSLLGPPSIAISVSLVLSHSREGNPKSIRSDAERNRQLKAFELKLAGKTRRNIDCAVNRCNKIFQQVELNGENVHDVSECVRSIYFCLGTPYGASISMDEQCLFDIRLRIEKRLSHWCW